MKKKIAISIICLCNRNELKNVRNIGKTFKGSQSLKVVLGNNQLGEVGEESIKEIGELRSLKELWLTVIVCRRFRVLSKF